MYGTMGIFGAARFGQETAGDCLVNTWLGGKREGWIDLAMALYLSISIPPMLVSLGAVCIADSPVTFADCIHWLGSCGCLGGFVAVAIASFDMPLMLVHVPCCHIAQHPFLKHCMVGYRLAGFPSLPVLTQGLSLHCAHTQLAAASPYVALLPSGECLIIVCCGKKS